jgi:NAD(P)-dependent dehydrogenase (short-subunit alcohol dehydrogenase family)
MTKKDSSLRRRFGPTALITGASDGIGRAIAVQLAEQGFDLILVARRHTALQELALELEERFGTEVAVIPIDLSAAEAVATVLEVTKGAQIGLVVAAAGFGSVGPFLHQDMVSEINMVDLNCRSVVELSHGFGSRMAQQGRGGIILFGSLVGFQGRRFLQPMLPPKVLCKVLPKGWLPNWLRRVSAFCQSPRHRSEQALPCGPACRWAKQRPLKQWLKARWLHLANVAPCGPVALPSSSAGRLRCCHAGVAFRSWASS